MNLTLLFVATAATTAPGTEVPPFEPDGPVVIRPIWMKDPNLQLVHTTEPKKVPDPLGDPTAPVGDEPMVPPIEPGPGGDPPKSAGPGPQLLPPGGGFEQGPPTVDPFTGPPPAGGRICHPGAYGPEPYRFGWQTKASAHWLLDDGQLGIFGIDAEARLRQQVQPGLIFDFAPLFGYRNIDGPGAPALPDDLFTFGADFQLSTPQWGRNPWSWKVGFTPTYNTDFNGGSSARAWNFDGRLAAVYQVSRNTSLMFGVMYWDRVSDIVLPWAGVIWRPDDRWEYRITFPRGRVSYFLGNGTYGGATWLYARYEYHVEAYEATVAGVADQIEFRDWRIMFGIRKQYGWGVLFGEVGLALGREVNLSVNPNFTPDTTFMARVGLAF